MSGLQYPKIPTGGSGENGPVRGETRTIANGRLEYLVPSTGRWRAAVRMDAIRGQLIQEASRQGSYTYPKARGQEPNNVTSFFLPDKDWGDEWDQRPLILKQLHFTAESPQRSQPPNGVKMHQGRTVLDPYDHPIRNFPNDIPATISSAVSGCDVERWQRNNKKIAYYDIMARCPSDYRDGHNKIHVGPMRVGTLREKATKFRRTAGLITNTFRKGSDSIANHVKGLLPPGAETTDSWNGDLNPRQVEALLAENLGTCPEKRRKNKRNARAMEQSGVSNQPFTVDGPYHDHDHNTQHPFPQHTHDDCRVDGCRTDSDSIHHRAGSRIVNPPQPSPYILGGHQTAGTEYQGQNQISDRGPPQPWYPPPPAPYVRVPSPQPPDRRNMDSTSMRRPQPTSQKRDLDGFLADLEESTGQKPSKRQKINAERVVASASQDTRNIRNPISASRELQSTRRRQQVPLPSAANVRQPTPDLQVRDEDHNISTISNTHSNDNGYIHGEQEAEVSAPRQSRESLYGMPPPSHTHHPQRQIPRDSSSNGNIIRDHNQTHPAGNNHSRGVAKPIKPRKALPEVKRSNRVSKPQPQKELTRSEQTELWNRLGRWINEVCDENEQFWWFNRTPVGEYITPDSGNPLPDSGYGTPNGVSPEGQKTPIEPTKRNQVHQAQLKHKHSKIVPDLIDLTQDEEPTSLPSPPVHHAPRAAVKSHPAATSADLIPSTGNLGPYAVNDLQNTHEAFIPGDSAHPFANAMEIMENPPPSIPEFAVPHPSSLHQEMGMPLSSLPNAAQSSDDSYLQNQLTHFPLQTSQAEYPANDSAIQSSSSFPELSPTFLPHYNPADIDYIEGMFPYTQAGYLSMGPEQTQDLPQEWREPRENYQQPQQDEQLSASQPLKPIPNDALTAPQNQPSGPADFDFSQWLADEDPFHLGDDHTSPNQGSRNESGGEVPDQITAAGNPLPHLEADLPSAPTQNPPSQQPQPNEAQAPNPAASLTINEVAIPNNDLQQNYQIPPNFVPELDRYNNEFDNFLAVNINDYDFNH